MYQRESRSARDSNIIVQSTSFKQVHAHILAIATRNMQPKTSFLLIQRLVELEKADAD